MSGNINRQMTLKQWLTLFFLACSWASSFVFIEYALTGFSPLQLVFFRLSIGAVGLAILVYILKLPLHGLKARLPYYAVLGFFTCAAPFSLITSGQVYITAGLSSIINSATPLVGIIIAHVFTKDEKITPSRLIGVIFGVIGVAILMGNKASNGSPQELKGVFLVLLASCCYGVAAVLSKKSSAVHPLISATIMLSFAALFLLPVMLIKEGFPQFTPNKATIGATIGIGLISTALAYGIYFKIAPQIGANNIMLVTILIPPLVLLASFSFLQEKIDIQSLLGLAIIILALTIIDGRLYRAFKTS